LQKVRTSASEDHLSAMDELSRQRDYFYGQLPLMCKLNTDYDEQRRCQNVVVVVLPDPFKGGGADCGETQRKPSNRATAEGLGHKLKIERIGPKRACRKIQMHGSKEKLLQMMSKRAARILFFCFNLHR